MQIIPKIRSGMFARRISGDTGTRKLLLLYKKTGGDIYYKLLKLLGIQ